MAVDHGGATAFGVLVAVNFVLFVLEVGGGDLGVFFGEGLVGCLARLRRR